MRTELISWEDVSALTDHLIDQFPAEFDAILIYSPDGIVPGGIIAGKLAIEQVYLVQVALPEEFNFEMQKNSPKLIPWPQIHFFPADNFLQGRTILIISSEWQNGRAISTIYNRAVSLGKKTYTAVFHYNPALNLVPDEKPDFFSAVTDAKIIYPWNASSGRKFVLSAGF